MQAPFKGNEKKHIPSKEVDIDHDVKQQANEADVKGEMEIRKSKETENKEKKVPDIPNKAKK